MKKKSLIILFCLSILILIFIFPYFTNKNNENKTSTNSKPVNKHVDINNSDNISEIKPENYTDELIISGVTLLTPVDDVLRVFGEPLKKEREIKPSRHQPDTLLMYIDTWVYEKIELVFFTIEEVNNPAPEKPDRLIYIFTSDENHSTVKGIKVGDSVEKLIEKYGPGELQNGYYSFGVDLEGYRYMDFKVENDIVTEIQYRSEPD